MKELLYTAIFAVLGIFLIILLFILFLPDDAESSADASTETQITENNPEAAASLYIPGLYNTQLLLNDQAINVEVIVDGEKITSLELVDLNETVETMYPLLQPTFDTLTAQILEKQSLEDISYSQDSKYTSLVLLEAIANALEKARP